MFQPEKFGIWEKDSKIIGIVRLESPWVGGVIIDVNPDYFELFNDMIHYAEETFSGMDDNGDKYLNVYLRDSDKLQVSLEGKGYRKGIEGRMLAFPLNETIPVIEIPTGFRLKSLEEIYDFNKLNSLLWRAFDYEGEPPSYEDDVYLPIKHAWLDYKRDICVVVEAPDLSYASFCGVWFDEYTKSAYIEPLATAQRYRGMGLAKACIYESMKKCKAIGAKIIYVEPDIDAVEWYKKIGFKQAYKSYCWSKQGL
ncbi:MAG: Acetyltransferase (GNAT) family protein [Firmicutes bacterium ADurb.Bin419]|nr:MAG: Acetyltransferase (GNAT) family protein [Firmicutes bacterium ADurb.Bin419]